MLETFISWYINAYLGKYIENLNAQQISFDIGQWEFELENLQLKKSILRSWKLPFEVRSGVVGRLKINLLKYFNNEPVFILLEDLYLVAGPLNLAEWDQMEEQAWTHEYKMNDLDGHEGRWKAQHDLSNESSYSNLYFSSMRIGASILAKVLENIQLNVQNFHIRFEEEIGSESQIAAFGITLESLTVQSCDSEWTPLTPSTRINPEDEYSYKTIQLKHFGIYCDPKGDRYSHFTPAELKESFKEASIPHEYLLKPVSAEGRIAKNTSSTPISNAKDPRFDVYLILDTVPFNLTDNQYDQCLIAFRNFRHLKKSCKLRAHRPFSSIQGNGGEWWRYAYNSIRIIRGHKIKKRLRKWDEIIERARNNVLYVEAYRMHLMNEFLTVEYQKVKDKMEFELDLEEIITLREVAMLRVERFYYHNDFDVSHEVEDDGGGTSGGGGERSVSECSNGENRSSLFSWFFPSWKKSRSQTSLTSPQFDSEESAQIREIELKVKASETQLEEEILKDLTSYERDALLARFNFILKEGVVTIQREKASFLELGFGGVDIKAEIKPTPDLHLARMDTPRKGFLAWTANNQLQIDFEFHRSNILLFGTFEGGGGGVRKIATASTLNAKVNLSLKNAQLRIEGVVGGLQITNPNPGQKCYQRILRVGQVPLIETSYSLISQSCSKDFGADSALTFSYETHLRQRSSSLTSIHLKMASFIYTHCPHFLLDLKKCINEFQVQAPFTKLRSAATQIALKIVRVEEKKGIVTKVTDVVDSPRANFELKVNITNCELIVVEDARTSNAIIFKSTSKLHYRPNSERPLSCNFIHVELFSCILGLSSSALSLLDPTGIHFEITYKKSQEPLGIEVLESSPSIEKILRFESPQLNLRLSYNDMKMFVKLIDAFPEHAQIYEMLQSEQNLMLESSTPPLFLPPTPLENDLEFVQPLTGIECSFNSLSICVIDDCRDADVPFLELTVNHMELDYDMIERCGNIECILNGDYYNRNLSGWEPFLEPWGCSIFWRKNEIGALGSHSPSSEFPKKAPELELFISSPKWLNINITSSLLSLYRSVTKKWTEDYHKEIKSIGGGGDRSRQPFIPYAIKNETGSPLSFSTIISNNEDVVRKRDTGEFAGVDATTWIKVPHGSTQSFTFERRGKLRHRNTHQRRTHQLILKVDGWQEVSPISVDKVGTYFRVIKPTKMSSRRYPSSVELPPSRLVFEVSLEGSAQKLVRVRSPLLVKNTLPDPLELKLENTILYPSFELAQTGGSFIARVQPDETYRIPLHSVLAKIWIRPLQFSPDSQISIYSYSTRPIPIGPNVEGQYLCLPIGEKYEDYRFSVLVEKDEFPIDREEPTPSTSPSTSSSSHDIVQLFSKRASMIILLPSVRLINRLPQELGFTIKGRDLGGQISPGKNYSFTNVNSCETLEFLFRLENFESVGALSISPKSGSYVGRIKLFDGLNRPLVLNAIVSRSGGDSLKIEIYCPYWIINKCGIPIIFKQEGTTSEAAGQSKDHEIGRMATPFLFNPIDLDGSHSLTMRSGRFLDNVKTNWTRPVHLQPGISIRKLSLFTPNSMETHYQLGVEISNYRNTKIIKISPRFVCNNLTESKVIEISQRQFANTFYDPRAESTHAILRPNSHLPFNWAKPAKEQLICVRLPNVKGCYWSGGFLIETIDSFQINIRDDSGNCYFLRVEVVLQGPTYFISFSDVGNLPPPIRVDNWSFVPITFHQTSLPDTVYQITTKPKSSCPYAWDERTEPPQITLIAPGGNSVQANMNSREFVPSLTYENFFYIILDATFARRTGAGESDGLESSDLVFDVHGTKIVLRKKEYGKRSQLWRVNVDGLIEHEGSNPTRDQNYKSSPLVLDIAGPAVQASSYVSLMLRKPDKRRKSTQTWEFTQDGRLKCAMYSNIYVQAKDGFCEGVSNQRVWNMWSDVVLGPPQPICFRRTKSGIPAEQAISRQKLRPGSGHLSICILTDGPSRVLRIIDAERPPKAHLLQSTGDFALNIQPKRNIHIELGAGLGFSIINCYPREELIYASFFGLTLKWNESGESIKVDLQSKNLQIDNQLHDGEKQVVVFVTPSETHLNTSALLLSYELLTSHKDISVFNYFELYFKPLSIILEERHILKLILWWRQGEIVPDLTPGLRALDFEVQNLVRNPSPYSENRFYFGVIRISLDQVRLSVLTSKLPPELATLRKQIGLTTMRFEDALVELDPFYKEHIFETYDFIFATVKKHFREELVSQAIIIFGSTDVLGNPLGFVNDVSVGVSDLIYEGSVGALVQNVTHGISNSAAKVAGTLGDGLGRVTMDEAHELERRKIREDHLSDQSYEHLVAGIKGLSHGVFGGLTSIIYRPYEGAYNQGVYGFFTGVGKGLVGTVTKPAVGVLDLAFGAAAAIADSYKSSSKIIPPRVRPIRVITGNGGLLPPFSEGASKGQDILYEMNDKNYSELFIACETLKGNDELKILVSSLSLIVFTASNQINTVILKIQLRDLTGCRVIPPEKISPNEKGYYIEFSLSTGSPQVFCENKLTAKRVVLEVMYAKEFFEERRHSSTTIHPQATSLDEDDY